MSSWRTRVERLQNEVRGKTEPELRAALVRDAGPKEYLRLGVFLIQNDRPAEAAVILEQAARSIDPAFFLPAARARELAGDTTHAESDYRAALTTDNRRSARLEYGSFLWRQRRYAEAASQFHDAPDQLWEAIAVVHSGDILRGGKMFTEIIDKDPSYDQNYIAYAATVARLGDHSQAASILVDGATQSHNPELLLLAIPQHLLAGNRDEALRVAALAIEHGIGITNPADYLDSLSEGIAKAQADLESLAEPPKITTSTFDPEEVGL